MENQPLADRIRPKTLDEFVGQQHLVAPGKPLFQLLKTGRISSMIFWGPPGVGKTTLARIIAQRVEQHGNLPIPLSLRNAPTRLMKDAGYGEGYEMYGATSRLPEKLQKRRFYTPKDKK